MAADSEGKLKSLSPVHENIANWLILNNDSSLRQCADHFGFTQSWLSSIIHSDLFQAMLKDKQERVFVKVAESIPEKLKRAADIGVEKLTLALEKTEDPEFILDATDKILHRMGYAPQSARNPAGAPSNQQNNFFINSSDLLEAQALMAAHSRQPALSDGLTLEGEAQSE